MRSESSPFPNHKAEDMCLNTVINYDFSSEIYELRKNVVQEERSAYPENTTTSEYWKAKYINLLEEYNTLLKNLKND